MPACCHWPDQEGGNFLMIPTQLCVFAMPRHMAIINQLLDIFWTATCSCWHILPNLLSSGTAKTAAQPLMRDRAGVAQGMVVTTSHIPVSAYLHCNLGCGKTCPKSFAGEQLFFSKTPKTKKNPENFRKSIPLCRFASIQHTVMLKKKKKYCDVILTTRPVNNMEELVSFIYFCIFLMCLLTWTQRKWATVMCSLIFFQVLIWYR